MLACFLLILEVLRRRKMRDRSDAIKKMRNELADIRQEVHDMTSSLYFKGCFYLVENQTKGGMDKKQEAEALREASVYLGVLKEIRNMFHKLDVTE